ncbi:subtilisin-like protease SBT3 [Castanea sativa]|uniref:subtilisin-like protease SBT3 n=1 Tax=Castanea sativa TaxID=21020 RepID=UPI003F652B80
MTFFQTITGIKPAPSVVANALRGPSRFPGILKPDVMAPGALVLAAWPSNIKVATDQKQRALHGDYTILSGTSIACPHATGVAALLKRAHPDWSPTAIKSCIMTTADTYDNTHNPIKDNKNNSIASPLAMGAGEGATTYKGNVTLPKGSTVTVSPTDVEV